MNIKRGLVLLSALGSAIMAVAEVQVADVKIASRYPWNGKVDITYTLLADNTEDDIYVNFVGYSETDMRNIFPSMGALSGDGATGPVKLGTHHTVWDVGRDIPNYTSDKFSVKVFAGKHLTPYIVIDLSAGPNATAYPMRLSMTPPDLSNDACRTTNLWMRLVLPGTFMMGARPDEPVRYSFEAYHKCTLTKPYYLGVFEVTQKQWYQVTGTWPSYFINPSSRETRPVEQVSWNAVCLTSSSFVTNLNNRVQKAMYPMFKAFTLPTEAQWEYACRAGTLTSYNNGKDIEGTQGRSDALSEVGRYSYNGTSYSVSGDTSGGTARVGTYLPNALGLYDMHGNVNEWCLDWYVGDLGTSAVTDPTGSASGSYRVLRGGYWGNNAQTCRSACRDCGNPSISSKGYGFRLCCPAGL